MWDLIFVASMVIQQKSCVFDGTKSVHSIHFQGIVKKCYNIKLILLSFFACFRNHNTKGARPQDPALWSSVGRAAREALKLRYRLLPHLYR